MTEVLVTLLSIPLIILFVLLPLERIGSMLIATIKFIRSVL